MRKYKRKHSLLKHAMSILFIFAIILSALYILGNPESSKEALRDPFAKQRVIHKNPKVPFRDNGNNTSNSNSEPRAEVIFRQSANLMLINKNHVIGADFVPTNLIKPFLGEKESLIKCPNKNMQFGQTMYDNLLAISHLAKESEIGQLHIISSYRSYGYQEKLFNSKVGEYKTSGNSESKSVDEASMWVAPPGASEHQAGFAVDVTFDSIDKEDFLDSEQGKWFRKTALEYGFILRYPEGISNITMIAHEPWHYRYVGVPHSLIIEENNFCFEEYIDYLKENPYISTTLDDGTSYHVFYAENAKGVEKIKADNYDLFIDCTNEISPTNTGGYIICSKQK